MSLIVLALACQGGETDPTGSGDTGSLAGHSGGTTPTTSTTSSTTTSSTAGTADTGSTATTDDPLPKDLNGVPPAVAKAAPEFFGVRNRDGSPRLQADLTDGHPTVLWFYPAAGTAG